MTIPVLRASSPPARAMLRPENRKRSRRGKKGTISGPRARHLSTSGSTLLELRIPVLESDAPDFLVFVNARSKHTTSLLYREGPLQAEFESLVKRSTAAWKRIQPEYAERGTFDENFSRNATRLRYSMSIQEVIYNRQFWFFQLRDSFLNQKTFRKWDPSQLDHYVLLPLDYGFVNNADCVFVSHYWRTKDHPDPHGIDLDQFQRDLGMADGDWSGEWSFIWVDWTCMPQSPRTPDQKRYFRRMLRCISMLCRDCCMSWRFPDFRPRAWVLAEIAEYCLTHRNHVVTDDNRKFINHLQEMVVFGVRPVLEKYDYKCTSESDMRLVTGWLELDILIAQLLPGDHNVEYVQQILDIINRPYVGSYQVQPLDNMLIDKAAGIITYKGVKHHFTPIYDLSVDS
ncbi:hypothetical protein D9757_011625 [Collybiopsis confluens]|uniref:Uncharacterized protein n=1 Tax=Collybiopsis confluens TaxID=2823264 RepID=A0A8H5GWT8_9AGAR|nr:hypothetical protein D9757_011625 [Collybiopsis confluens]